MSRSVGTTYGGCFDGWTWCCCVDPSHVWLAGLFDDGWWVSSWPALSPHNKPDPENVARQDGLSGQCLCSFRNRCARMLPSMLSCVSMLSSVQANAGGLVLLNANDHALGEYPIPKGVNSGHGPQCEAQEKVPAVFLKNEVRGVGFGCPVAGF